VYSYHIEAVIETNYAKILRDLVIILIAAEVRTAPYWFLEICIPWRQSGFNTNARKRDDADYFIALDLVSIETNSRI